MLELSEVVAFVRGHTACRAGTEVVGETRLEADLGVTGDDGADLLAAAEARFSVSLTDDLRAAFGLGPNEVLFASEGLEIPGMGRIWHWLRGTSPPVVRDLTVAQLHRVILGRAEE